LYKPRYHHLVLNFVALATRVGWGMIWLAALDGPSLKTPKGAKISLKSFTQAKL